LVAAKHASIWHVPAVTQATLAAFIGEGDLARHVRKMRAVYAERHDVLIAADWLRPVPSVAGMHVCALLPGSVQAADVMPIAAEAGIGFQSKAFHAEPTPGPECLIFGFGLIERQDIETALRGLARALNQSRHLRTQRSARLENHGVFPALARVATRSGDHSSVATPARQGAW